MAITEPTTARVWTMGKGGRRATCDLSRHPLGLELFAYVDGVLLRSQLFRGPAAGDAARVEAHAWREAFGATGWTDSAADS